MHVIIWLYEESLYHFYLITIRKQKENLICYKIDDYGAALLTSCIVD